MMVKKTIVVATCVLFAFFANGASKWKNIDDKSHVCGPKLTTADLLGNVVLVYYWDASVLNSIKFLSETEKIWNSYKTKKFIVVGSYQGARNDASVKEIVEKNKITFPIYYKFSLDPDPKVTWEGLPYFNVVNHRGQGVYNGRMLKECTAKIDDMISVIGMPIALCGDVEFKKFKGMAGQLKLGKNLTNVMKTLEKKKSDKDPDVASEASEIFSAIESAKSDVKEDIELYREADPAEAIKVIELFIMTWPKDDSAKDYKASLPELKKAAAKAKAEKRKAK